MAKHSSGKQAALDAARAQDNADDADNADNDEAVTAQAREELKRREERNAPMPLDEEDIGLNHISGVDEEEVGRELNLSGTADNDEDDDGNPVLPDDH